jgi:RNA polymerase sigma factor for flagellar operon FliA
VTQAKVERLSTENVQRLWEQYHASGDARDRDRLVLSLAPMVKYIVYRKVREIPSRCEVEDFISSGIEALMRSIDRYDPGLGASLEQFAWTRINGAVLDELRRNDWAPRSLRRTERDISRARESFIAIQGRAPTKAELAGLVGISVDQLETHLGLIYRSEIGSLNDVIFGEDEVQIERIDTLTSHDQDADPVSSAVRDDVRERFRAAFEQLPDRERQIAILLYVHNLTLREIGEVLGLTESRICQIHGKLRRRLRDAMSSDDQYFSEAA